MPPDRHPAPTIGLGVTTVVRSAGTLAVLSRPFRLRELHTPERVLAAPA